MEPWSDGLYAGKSLSNPATGRTVTFLELSPELLDLPSWRIKAPDTSTRISPSASSHSKVRSGRGHIEWTSAAATRCRQPWAPTRLALSGRLPIPQESSTPA